MSRKECVRNLVLQLTACIITNMRMLSEKDGERHGNCNFNHKSSVILHLDCDFN